MASLHHHHSHRPSPLEIRQLAAFDLTISDLPPDEQEHRRIVYLREAAAEMELGRSLLKGFGCVIIPFFIIPVFWPFLVFFWFMRKKANAMMDAQLDTALDYWGLAAEDIGRARAPSPVIDTIEVAGEEEPRSIEEDAPGREAESPTESKRYLRRPPNH